MRLPTSISKGSWILYQNSASEQCFRTVQVCQRKSLSAGALIGAGGPLEVYNRGPGYGLQVGGSIGREGVGARDALGVGAAGEGVTGVAAGNAGV